MTNTPLSNNVKRLKVKPRIIPSGEHSVTHSAISDNALKVLFRLKNAGYKAYLVGGGVRDILLGMGPKDFDVVTDARPEQIRELFRNCRLIGRRFRLAHIHFGREIIEVSTFRAPHHAAEGEGHTEEGRIIRDNVYGDIDDDVWRRDFTVNALFYNIADGSIVDYVGALSDIETQKASSIDILQSSVSSEDNLTQNISSSDEAIQSTESMDTLEHDIIAEEISSQDISTMDEETQTTGATNIESHDVEVTDQNDDTY